MRFEEIGHTEWQLVDTYENPLEAFFGSLSVQTFGSQKLSGEFTISPDYKGCPFCRTDSFFVCGACGQPNCNESVTLTDGKPVSVTCVKCGNKGDLSPMEELTLAEDYTISS